MALLMDRKCVCVCVFVSNICIETWDGENLFCVNLSRILIEM